MFQTTAMNPVNNRAAQTMTMPGLLLRLEGLAFLLGALVLYSRVSGDWLAFMLLLFTPDVAMIGYLFNPRIGAALYNSAHYYGLPLALGLAALLGGWTTGIALALIWTAHISLDRLLGYGLKYGTAFKDTHMGRA